MKAMAITASILALTATGAFAWGEDCASKVDQSASVAQPEQSTVAGAESSPAILAQAQGIALEPATSTE